MYRTIEIGTTFNTIVENNKRLSLYDWFIFSSLGHGFSQFKDLFPSSGI